jgi:hypothetical protein
VAFVLGLLVAEPVLGFSRVVRSTTARGRCDGVLRANTPGQTSRLFSTPGSEDDTVSTTEEPVPSSPPKEPEGASYPIDLPSPILLSSAMLLGITSIGKLRGITTFLQAVGCCILNFNRPISYLFFQDQCLS